MTCDNRPRKGAHIKVEPIRYLADIKRIKNLLVNRPRDMALFTLGINTPLRVSDLLRLTYHQVSGLSPGDFLSIHEKRTGRRLKVGFNSACCAAVANLDAAHIPFGRACRPPLLSYFKAVAATCFCRLRFIVWSSPGAKRSALKAITGPIHFVKHGAIISSPPSVQISRD